MWRRARPLAAWLLTAQYEGSQSSSQDTMERDTRETLSEVERAFSEKQEALVQRLLDRVAEVNPEPPRNLKKVSA